MGYFVLSVIIVSLLALLAHRERGWRERETELADMLEIVEDRCDEYYDQNEKLISERDTLRTDVYKLKGQKLHLQHVIDTEKKLHVEQNEMQRKLYENLMVELNRAYANLEMIINQYNPISLKKEDHEDYYSRTRCSYSARRVRRRDPVRSNVDGERKHLIVSIY